MWQLHCAGWPGHALPPSLGSISWPPCPCEYGHQPWCHRPTQVPIAPEGSLHPLPHLEGQAPPPPYPAGAPAPGHIYPGAGRHMHMHAFACACPPTHPATPWLFLKPWFLPLINLSLSSCQDCSQLPAWLHTGHMRVHMPPYLLLGCMESALNHSFPAPPLATCKGKPAGSHSFLLFKEENSYFSLSKEKIGDFFFHPPPPEQTKNPGYLFIIKWN